MRRIVMAAALGGVAAGCSVGQDLQAVDAATASFHQRFNAGQFQAIYDDASSNLKATTNAASFLQLMQGLRGRLGAFQSAKRLGFQDNLAAGTGHRVTVTYASVFAAGKATETIVYALTSAGPVMTGYNVSSPVLLLNGPPSAGAAAPAAPPLSPQEASAAAVAVAAFHKQYDAGQYAAIYGDATPRFRATSPQATTMIEGFHTLLGPVRSMTLINGNESPPMDGAHAMVVRYATAFERGSGVETFGFLFEQGQARLLGYNLKANTGSSPSASHTTPTTAPPPAG